MLYEQGLTPDRQADLERQHRLLGIVRRLKHKTLLRNDVPKAIATYGMELLPDDSVAQEVLEGIREPHQFFVWRQDIKCLRDETPGPDDFTAEVYKLGYFFDESVPTSALYLPNAAARLHFEDGTRSLIYPAILAEGIVSRVVTMADLIHDSPKLPNLTGHHPDILSDETIQALMNVKIDGGDENTTYTNAEIWDFTDPEDIIPFPWSPTCDAVPTKRTDQ